MTERGNTAFISIAIGFSFLATRGIMQRSVQNTELALRLGGIAMLSSLALLDTSQTTRKAVGAAGVLFFPELLGPPF